MLRKSAWWKGVSAVPVCVALSLPAICSLAEETPSPLRSSRRAAPTEAGNPTRAAEISLDEAGDENAPAKVGDKEEAGPAEVELIQERYPNGAIKIEREMIQDAEGNYIRHGSWTHYEQGGNILARGRYEKEERHGTWTRLYKGDESPIFTQAPYNEYKGPFISQTTFENGRLNGKWIISDSKQHKISEITFENGQRNGIATWWYANGSKMQEIPYRDGLVDGELQQWDVDAKPIKQETYQAGRRTTTSVAHYPNGQKRSEESFLTAPVTIDTADDWWNARFLVLTAIGKDVKHGISTAYHENGQKKLQGQYQNNLPEGKFVWWYATGQKSLEGTFQNGKANGTWTWWHENGQKSIKGEYKDGAPVGKWNWWKEDGRVAQNADVTDGERLVHDVQFPAAQTATLPEEPIQAPSILKR